MPHRFLVIAVTLIPVCSPVMQFGHVVGLALLQACTQEIGEKLVIPIPGMLLIQGDDEQVGLLQVQKPCLAVCVSCHLPAEGSIQTIQERGVQQKLLDLFRLFLKHLFHEVGYKSVVTARESCEKTRSITLSLQRETGELQTGDPPFGTRFQYGDLVTGQVQPHDGIEKQRRLLKRKAQISSADLSESMVDPQASQREGRIAASRHEQMQLFWQMIEQKRQRRMNGRCDDLVVVIKDEHHIVLKTGKIVDEGGQDVLNGKRLAGADDVQHFLCLLERARTERI